jgi:hypothetical protein
MISKLSKGKQDPRSLFFSFSNLPFLFFLKEKKGQSEWNTLYIILILAIAAVVLIAVVKPMFKGTEKVVASQPVAANPAPTS